MEALDRYLQHPAPPTDAGREVRALSRQHVQLAEKSTRAMPGDQRLTIEIRTDDVDRAFENHEERIRLVARSIQGVACIDDTFFAERCQLGECRGIQCRRRVLRQFGRDVRVERRNATERRLSHRWQLSGVHSKPSGAGVGTRSDTCVGNGAHGAVRARARGLSRVRSRRATPHWRDRGRRRSPARYPWKFGNRRPGAPSLRDAGSRSRT